ncbi:MAG: hypothetical protein KIT33_06870 [Candidatus Kapabacteria bacterium]|nr:hypothetical protein [Ignavibacteriota bacterium]MCW5884678.1 hypothetical protein [Candidatus Kapabacteria bacterium]
MKKFFFLILLMGCTVSQEIYNVSKVENQYIYEKSIKIFSGEEIYIDAEVVDNKIISYKRVDNKKHSPNTIGLSLFSNNSSNKKTSNMYVTNQFEKRLTYKAKYKQTSQNKYNNARVHPVMPKAFSGTLFQFEVESIIFYDFEIEIEKTE